MRCAVPRLATHAGTVQNLEIWRFADDKRLSFPAHDGIPMAAGGYTVVTVATYNVTRSMQACVTCVILRDTLLHT